MSRFQLTLMLNDVQRFAGEKGENPTGVLLILRKEKQTSLILKPAINFDHTIERFMNIIFKVGRKNHWTE